MPDHSGAGEPVAKTGAILAVIRTGLLLVTAFGLDLTREQIIGVQTFAEAVLQLLVVGVLPSLSNVLPWRTVRDKVTPVPKVDGDYGGTDEPVNPPPFDPTG